MTLKMTSKISKITFVLGRSPALLLFVLSLAILTLSKKSWAKPEDHCVRVLISQQSIDIQSPWEKTEVRQKRNLGCLVAKGDTRWLLTTAYPLVDAKLIEMQRFGFSKREALTVHFVDYEVNLALLSAGGGGFSGLQPIPLGDDLSLNDEVVIYKPRDLYQLAKLPAHLQEVGVYSAVTSSYGVATYLFKVHQSALGWAEPVMHEDALVALSTGQDKNFVHALPISIIRHFLDDVSRVPERPYRGFPGIGISITPLESPDLRAYLKADKFAGGMVIKDVFATSPFLNKLLVDDVLLKVDGHEISEHGVYTHPTWGKIHFIYLLNEKYAGDSLELTFSRGGVLKRESAILKRIQTNDRSIVFDRYGDPEPHMIFGGLVIQELTRDYLKQWGNDWANQGPFDLLYVHEYKNDVTDVANSRFVMLNKVLADDFNKGYEKIRHQIIEEVNGVSVKSIEDVKRGLREHPQVINGKSFARIKFSRDGGEVIIGYEGLADVHKRLKEAYEVHSQDSFFEL
jgi:hypothetical protein